MDELRSRNVISLRCLRNKRKQRKQRDESRATQISRQVVTDSVAFPIRSHPSSLRIFRFEYRRAIVAVVAVLVDLLIRNCPGLQQDDNVRSPEGEIAEFIAFEQFCVDCGRHIYG